MNVKRRFPVLVVSAVLALCLGGGIAYASDGGKSTEPSGLSAASTGLKAQATESEPNDTIARATSISLNGTVAGSITAEDERDYYRFVLPSSGKLSITGTSYMEWTYYYIYDANGNEVWGNNNSWNSTTRRQDLSWQVDLTSGTYYFCVARDGSRTGAYNFKLACASANETFKEGQGGSNNSIDMASSYTLGSSCSAQIAANDDRDFFRFTLPSSGKLSITGTSYMEWTYYYIYDANGNEVWGNNNSWNSTTRRQDLSWQVDLTSGTYYFCVARDGSRTGAYNFKLARIRSINSASIGGIVTKMYTGKAITQSPVVKVGSTTLKSGVDYGIKYANNKNVGKASLTITGKGAYKGRVTRNFTIKKATNTLTASAKSKILTVEYSKLKKKDQAITKSKAFKLSGNKGAVTFKKLSGNKKIVVSKTGTIAVKKGLKKSIYTVKVQVKAAGNGNYKAKTVDVALRICVK